MISSRMSKTQKSLGDAEVKLVSFSVDRKHDTPAVLRDYAARLNA
jgi:cytochrome oxidase Cu insertion factor (SCO1/SenC/PrrC family)